LSQARLAQRVALVTGAGRGIGASTAAKLAQEGASVIVNDLDQQACQQVAAEIVAAGGQAAAYAADVTEQAVAEQLVEFAVDSYGSLDILVNNAGYVWNSAMHRHSDEQWQAMLDIHATAPVRILRAYYPWLKARVEQEQAQDVGIRVC